MKFRHLFFFIFFLLKADIGSDFNVEVFNTQQTVTNDCRIKSFAALNVGFSLLDSAVTGIFDSFFAVMGTIDLSGGTLALDKDLILTNTSQLNTMGTIVGNGHVLSLAKNISLVPATSSSQCFEWGNLTVCLNSNVTFKDCCITFTGNSIISGQGNCLTLLPTCTIRIAANSSLLLKNIIVQGLETGRIIPLDSTSTLSLKSAKLFLDNNYTFSQGTLDIKNKVSIFGDGLTFTFGTDQLSTINQDSTLKLNDGLIFDYAPSNNEQDLLKLVDKSATLFLNGATLKITGTDLLLTKGTLLVDRNAQIVEG